MDTDQHRLYSEQNDLTARRQQHRKEYMKTLASVPNAPITPQEQAPQADRWWPGTTKTKWEQHEK